MKILQKLTITGEAENVSAWLDDLEANPAPWIARDDMMRKSPQPQQYNYPRSAAFDAPKTSSFAGATVFLFVRNEGTECYLANTVTKYQGMPVEYYNNIVATFYRNCVAPRLSRFALNATLTRDEEFIEDILSPETLRLLETFSRLANKHAGSGYPADNQRWQEFTAASAKGKQILSRKLLQNWLEEQGFPTSVAFELAAEYERYIEFSQRYDSVEATQEFVHA